MSLINQMLRDLQQRQGRRPPVATAAPPRRTRRSRRLSVAGMVVSVPPLVWVGAGGLAGLALLWGVSGWLSGVIGPDSPAPVPSLPQELVAVAQAPSPPPSGSDLPAVARRRAPPLPIDVPPPAPPLAYVSAEPPVVAPSPLPDSPAPVLRPVSSQPMPAMSPTTAYREEPPTVVPRHEGEPPRGDTASRVAASADLPVREHPDMLPGAVNTANLALQRAVRAAAVAPPPLATPYGQAEDFYQEGREAYAANRTDLSIEALRRALELYPGHLPARELLADQLEMGGRIDEAYALLRQGLSIAPDYAPFRKRAARMLLDRGDAAGAVRALTGTGLPRVDADPELHRMLAVTYLKLGEYFLAAQTFRNLVVFDSRAGESWLGLGDALAADGQPDEARRAYRKALAVGGLSREEAARARSGSARP